MAKLPKQLLDRIKAVKNKRASLVLDEIVRNGLVTTETIEGAGYKHAPRAVRDARELGFVIDMSRVKSSTGKSIAEYRLNVDASLDIRKAGRRAIPKKLRDELISEHPSCSLCGSKDNLQLDHRVPYEIAGERDGEAKSHFMIACGSCQRSKSWQCEHCPNIIDRREKVCESCYWASPTAYSHVATRPERRIELVLTESEDIKAFDQIKVLALEQGIETNQQVKNLIRSVIKAR